MSDWDLQITEFFLDMKEEAAMSNFKAYKEEVENEEVIKRKKQSRLFTVEDLRNDEAVIYTNLEKMEN